jgi:hypothetical protein
MVPRGRAQAKPDDIQSMTPYRAFLAQAVGKSFWQDVLRLSDEPSSFVNIELYQTFASHFQQKRLAGFLIHDIGAFHDLIDFERLLAERAQDILSVIQHG